MDAASVLSQLERSATVLEDLNVPEAPGVYALFLSAGTSLPAIRQPGSGALYIGLSSKLAQREFDTHFSDRSGFSTVRRSIGALLKVPLDLKARPRGSGASPTNTTHYAFDGDGERRLSTWMRERVRVAVHQVDEPAAFERELIALAQPPLNLTGWPNPDAVTIKALRKACADESRRRQGRQ